MSRIDSNIKESTASPADSNQFHTLTEKRIAQLSESGNGWSHSHFINASLQLWQRATSFA